MKKVIITIIILIFVIFGIGVMTKGFFVYKNYLTEKNYTKERELAIDKVIDSRISKQNQNYDNNPFGEKEEINILLIGLDRRIGVTSSGHCDAIQMVEIDKNKEIVTITAVPRGTYSPLPPGKGATSSDYYISNACDLGGLEYGINQIEKILRQKADYIIVVGFSEVMGILRNLKLPATDTLRWLRHRQSYQIGEPQRAHNHSTFIKQMMIRHIPEDNTTFDSALQYLIFRKLKTDLTFAQTKVILSELSKMNLKENTGRIILTMNPPFPVQDIEYDPENLNLFLQKKIDPIKHLLAKDDFSGIDSELAQKKLIESIENNIQNEEFVIWAFENYLWLQIDDDAIRLDTQYEFLVKYISIISEKKEREIIIADYILEMEYFEQNDYVVKAKKLLQKELGY